MSSVLANKSHEIASQVDNHIQNLRMELESLQAKLKEEQNLAQRASAMGDRSENAEWQIANDNIARYTVSIVSLMNTLDTYEKYTTSYKATGKVMVGSTLKVIDKLHSTSLYIKIYPPGLGNAKIGAISTATPLGSAVLGKVPGTEVIVKAPLGDIPYLIEEVL